MVGIEEEKRRARRFNLDWPVCLWHEGTEKFYSARSVNLSSTGALLQLPLTVPVRLSEQVAVNFPVPEGQISDRYPSKVFSAKVVRINRGQSILEAQQSVAVRFE